MKVCPICEVGNLLNATECEYCNWEFEDMIDPDLLWSIKSFERSQVSDWQAIMDGVDKKN